MPRTTICCTILTGCLTTHAQVWHQLPDFPGTARDDAASFVIGTTIHVGTGMEVGWGLTNDWFRFDAIGSEWHPMAPLPAEPRQYCSTFTLHDKGYLFGGTNGAQDLNELWEYDPSDDSWTQRASLPAQGRRACAAFSDGVHGHIVTGMVSGDVPTRELWRYDPGTDSWVQRAPLPGVPRHRAAAFLTSAPIVVGGADADNAPLADGYAYDAALDQWTTIADMPEPRFSHRAAEGVVVGGATSFTNEHADTWYHAYSSDSWSEVQYPAFAGGPRRGAVAEWITFFGLTGIYTGLGLHANERYKDWWHLDLGMGIDTHPAPAISVHPNPAHTSITINTVRWPEDPTVHITDMQGCTVRTAIARRGVPLDIGDLAPGRYAMTMALDGVPVSAHFIKLP